MRATMAQSQASSRVFLFGKIAQVDAGSPTNQNPGFPRKPGTSAKRTEKKKTFVRSFVDEFQPASDLFVGDGEWNRALPRLV